MTRRPFSTLLARMISRFVLFAALSWIGGSGLWARPAHDTTLFLPLVSTSPARLLIAAAHIDSALTGEADEAILLWNVGIGPQPLAGWQITAGTRTTHFPITTTLSIAPSQRIWCAAEAATFRITFGESAACEWGADTEPGAVDLAGDLALANGGGRIQLLDAHGQVADTLLYGDETMPADGWEGLPAQLYTRGDMPTVGQVWQRKLDPRNDLPIDSDRASDWAGDLDDLAWGRRVRLPGWAGWDAEDVRRPIEGVTMASVTVLVGPEGFFHPLADLIERATNSIDLAIYTFEHVELAQKLADAARRGVRVRVLVEGSPAGGIVDLEKWSLAQIAAAGGDVRFFAVADHAPKGYRPRYRFIHAKYLLIDERIAVNGTENFSDDAFPVTNGEIAGGRRGYYLVTDAVPVVSALRQIFAADWAPERFLDTRPFEHGHERYGGPPVDFALPERPVYPVDEAPFAQAQTFSGMARFQVVTTPDNALRPDAGLFALLDKTSAGDEILLEQLYEHRNWGIANSNPIADPNPRLTAIVAAARRGVRVRILLDQFFDEKDSVRTNQATVDYLNAIATAEGLDLQARRGNPTLGGIHAKLLLVRTGNESWSAVGSLNGGETSFKLNREVVVMTDMPGVYTRLAEVFAWDWRHAD
jgi:phosphatidylserine/phosphatidylglycerophosphate/cardiolipin synthase-like enzyme